LSTLLGGETETVPAYAGIRSMEPREAAREATAAVAGGFTAVKVKLGRGSLEDDLEVIRTVREAVGDEVALMVDYNQSLTVAEALHRGRALEGEGLTWIEEPVEADDYTGHASVARELHTPIQLGENWWGPKDMAQSIAANGSDYATFDAVRIGGVTGWLRAAALAEVAGLPVSSHRFPEVSASLLAATPVAHWLEFVDTVSPVLAHPLHVEGGRARVPSEPGLGLAWDEDAVARYLVE
jgi:mandelate racemase